VEAILILVGIVLALAAFHRTRVLESRIQALQAELDLLKSRASTLPKPTPIERDRPAAEARPPVAPPPAEVPVPPRPVTAPPVPLRPVAAPPPVAAPAVTAQAPERPPAGAPPADSSPRFDWESLLGLKGAAWLGGVTLVIAGIFLAKMAYEAGFFKPTLRLAAMVLFGVGGLAWAEISLRRGYATTANAVSGAAIAVLYIAFYAGRAVWHLLPLGLTFFLMALVTVVAGFVAIRYDAVFSAVLGLLGGFATPVVLSTGQDRPLSLFSYVLLLNAGLAAVALKKRWHGLVLMGFFATLAIEVGWALKFLAPEKMGIALLAFLVFGLLYLLLPLLAGKQESLTLLQAGAAGAVVPFLFAVFLAGSRAYAGEWQLLFGYLGLLDAALIAVALFRGRTFLLLGGALATGLTLPVWAAQGLGPAVWGPTLAAIGLTALLNAAPRLGRRLAPGRLAEGRMALEGAGVAAATGLGLYTLVLVVRTPAEPPWPFLALLAALFAIFLERTGEGRVVGVTAFAAIALAMVVQIWFHDDTTGATLVRNLGVASLFTIALSLVAGRRARAPAGGVEDEAGVVGAVLVAYAGLLGCLVSAELAGDPIPLFAALALEVALLVVSARRRDWTWLVPAGLLASSLFALAWQETWFRAAGLAVALPIYASFYLAFLALPFAVSAWKDRPVPWISSALSGPLLFPPLYRALSLGWGKAWIGALPVILAAISFAALAGVGRRFAPAPAGTPEARRRLGYLALFAAVAMGFLAVAVPLQLDRQWITVAWALEAAAVWWLFGRLPHPGLKAFGALLFAGVGARLLLNPEVLRYQERGLPVLNWLLYTYGVPALCCLLGAWLLKRAESARRHPPDWDLLPGDRTQLAPAASLLGLLLIFALINLEIIDFFSTARYVELSMERQFARDLAMSSAWAIYAMALLLIGLWRRVRGLRILSLGFLLLTVAKVFLYDLANLVGLYRILSFLGLGVALILVSLLYQRFVLVRERRPARQDGRKSSLSPLDPGDL
jgi:uncharacterized membrane protein